MFGPKLLEAYSYHLLRWETVEGEASLLGGGEVI